MFFKKVVLLQLIFFIPFLLNTQIDTLKLKTQHKHQFIKKAILPLSLITIGSLLSGSSFEKNLNTDIINAVGNDYEFRIDDYIQYAPIVEMYAADAFGVKAKNHWFGQTKNLVISDLLTGVIVFSLKNITNKTRPNGSPYAFPSGHTALAFTNAGVLYQEFKDTNPVLAFSGYGFAATTGAFRMLNNKHWLSDVIVGAGIGICIPKLIYYLEPLKNWNPFKNNKGISFVPLISTKQYGVYAQIIF